MNPVITTIMYVPARFYHEVCDALTKILGEMQPCNDDFQRLKGQEKGWFVYTDFYEQLVKESWYKPDSMVKMPFYIRDNKTNINYRRYLLKNEKE